MGYGNNKVLPKSAKDGDSTGEKRVGASKVDAEKFHSGASGEKMTKGVLSSDTSGERKTKIVGGVAMGKADGIGLRDGSHMGKIDGRTGELNTGSSERTIYEHKRIPHVQDGM